MILSTQILEHVEDPAQHLRKYHRTLRNDGLLILSTRGYRAHRIDLHDFWRWTSEGLKK